MSYSLSVWDYHNNKLIDLKSKNISILGQVYNANFTKNINGYKELSFVLPLYVTDSSGDKVKQISNFRWDFIQTELLVKLEDRDGYDWFIIKTLDEVRSDGGIITSNIQCKHISNLLVQSGIDLYIDEVGNAYSLLALILQDSGWTIGSVDTFESDGIEKMRTLKVERSNRYTAIQDLAELFGGYPVFNPDRTVDFKEEVGQNDGVVFRNRKNLKNITRNIGNTDVITKLWIEGGSDDVGVVTISDINPTGENYILDFSYFIDGGFLNQEQLDAITNFEIEVKTSNTNIGTDLSNINTAYNSISEKEALVEGKILAKSAKVQTKAEIDLQIQTETNSTTRAALVTQSNTLQTEINTLTTEINTLKSQIDSLNTSLTNYENNLTTHSDDKYSLISNLNLLLADFIREGLWQDSNYVDAQALYTDGLEQSKKYAYPQVAYDMSILDLSYLTGYEIEKFRLGDIIRIVDDSLRVDTLGRITEMSLSLDKPQNVSVQIGNYHGSFEDLFKRIAQSAEIIKQRQDVYERAVGINPDGTINFDILQATFDANKFRVVTGTNNTVITDENGITVIDAVDANKKVRINSGGIFITTDGGENWKVGMSPDGLSALNITSGVIDTKILQIWNSDQPRFKWSAEGLFAYGDDGSGGVDTDKWIRFNKDGLVFTLDNGATYEGVWGWDGISLNGYITVTDLATEGATEINGSNITTGKIKSQNYVANVAGTSIDLVNGVIDTKNFKVDSQGNIIANNGTFTGNITGSNMTGGTIVGSTIKTAASGNRLEMTNNVLSGYQGSILRTKLSHDSLLFYDYDGENPLELSYITYADKGYLSSGTDIIVTTNLIVAGKVLITPTANSPSGVSVGWVPGFPEGLIPSVVATASTTVPGSTVMEVSVSNATEDSVTIYVYRTNTTNTSVHWIAYALSF